MNDITHVVHGAGFNTIEEGKLGLLAGFSQNLGGYLVHIGFRRRLMFQSDVSTKGVDQRHFAAGKLRTTGGAIPRILFTFDRVQNR